jgi:hypothetical protein
MVKTKNMAILGRGFGRNCEPNVAHIFDLEPPISRSLPIMWGEYQKNLQNFVEYQLKYPDIEPIDVKFFRTYPHFIHCNNIMNIPTLVVLQTCPSTIFINMYLYPT